MNVGDFPFKCTLQSVRLVLICLMALMPTACSTQKASFASPEVESQIDWTLSFEQIKESPATYLGKVVIWGGEVLYGKRFKDHTKLIILQLPLGSGEDPVSDRTQSEGRFIARQAEFLDPATIPPGTRVTVIGELSGSKTELLDEMNYTYPVVTIKHLEVWPIPQYLPYYSGPYYSYPYAPLAAGGWSYGRYGYLYGPFPYYWY